MMELLVYAFPAAMVYAAFSDLARYEIPNWLSIALVVVFLALALGLGMGWGELASRAGAGVLLFAVGAVLFALGALGGGDVKLLAASALWVGWSDIVLYLVAVALFGGLVSIILVIMRWIWGRFGKTQNLTPEALLEASWWHRLMAPTQGVPYGLAICLGGLLWFVRIPAGLGI